MNDLAEKHSFPLADRIVAYADRQTLVDRAAQLWPVIAEDAEAICHLLPTALHAVVPAVTLDALRSIYPPAVIAPKYQAFADRR